eukprot:2962018-Pleurochrysis_carterae.AAC.3
MGSASQSTAPAWTAAETAAFIAPSSAVSHSSMLPSALSGLTSGSCWPSGERSATILFFSSSSNVSASIESKIEAR